MTSASESASFSRGRWEPVGRQLRARPTGTGKVRGEAQLLLLKFGVDCCCWSLAVACRFGHEHCTKWWSERESELEPNSANGRQRASGEHKAQGTVQLVGLGLRRWTVRGSSGRRSCAEGRIGRASEHKAVGAWAGPALAGGAHS